MVEERNLVTLTITGALSTTKVTCSACAVSSWVDLRDIVRVDDESFHFHCVRCGQRLLCHLLATATEEFRLPPYRAEDDHRAKQKLVEKEPAKPVEPPRPKRKLPSYMRVIK